MAAPDGEGKEGRRVGGNGDDGGHADFIDVDGLFVGKTGIGNGFSGFTSGAECSHARVHRVAS